MPLNWVLGDEHVVAEKANEVQGVVTFVGLNKVHGFSKQGRQSIVLLEGLGIAGDAHCGATVKHRSRVAKDPTQPNLRQVHLIHGELHDELNHMGFQVGPGDMGENITTRGLRLLGCPVGTKLYLGAQAVVQLTGLRNPCAQLDDFQPGLLRAVLGRDANGKLVRKAGVMGIVLQGGEVTLGDVVRMVLPVGAHRPLERV